MSLDKAIRHGKEHRKPYRKPKATDKSCRNHGARPWCERERKYKVKRAEPAPDGNGLVLHGPYEGYFGDIEEE